MQDIDQCNEGVEFSTESVVDKAGRILSVDSLVAESVRGNRYDEVRFLDSRGREDALSGVRRIRSLIDSNIEQGISMPGFELRSPNFLRPYRNADLILHQSFSHRVEYPEIRYVDYVECSDIFYKDQILRDILRVYTSCVPNEEVYRTSSVRSLYELPWYDLRNLFMGITNMPHDPQSITKAYVMLFGKYVDLCPIIW